MHRLLAFTLVLTATCFAGPASASDLMPPYIMDQLGLTQAWARPMQVPIGAQSIGDQQLFVHEQNPREYVEIVMVPPATEGAASASGEKPAEAVEGKVLGRIPTDTLKADGSPIGLQEAERLANNEIRRMKRRGIDAKTQVRTVKRVHLYTVATDGTVECRDAETGEPVWMVRVGDRRLPYMAIGVSEDFLTIVNGANLMQLEAATGEVIEEVPMPGAPRFGAINTGDFAMIPMVGGRILGYPLKDPTIDPFLEQVAGAALSLPTKSPNSSLTAWGTDRGFVYVIEMDGEPSVRFRLNTDGIVSGRIATAPGDRFFFGSESGQVYGMRATLTGKVLWSVPLGEPIYNSPMVFEEQVLIRTTYGNLFSLNLEDGAQTWLRPLTGVGEFLAAFDGKLYATTLSGALTVINLADGVRVGTYPQIHPNRLLVNNLTNRLYLVSDSGDVQCLKPEGSDLPVFNDPADPTVEAVEEEAAERAANTGVGFGDGGDPFGGGDSDPFNAGGGGESDPFGGGDDAAMEDPFGGDAGGDPFGESNPFGG